ncbi:MAG: hypothetical protein R2708_24770 [Vicinamibacterales bacterium]
MSFKAINYLLALTTGLDYKVVALERTEWITDGSVGLVFEKNQGIDVTTSGALLAGEKLTHSFAEKTKASSMPPAACGRWTTSKMPSTPSRSGC